MEDTRFNMLVASGPLHNPPPELPDAMTALIPGPLGDSAYGLSTLLVFN